MLHFLSLAGAWENQSLVWEVHPFIRLSLELDGSQDLDSLVYEK